MPPPLSGAEQRRRPEETPLGRRMFFIAMVTPHHYQPTAWGKEAFDYGGKRKFNDELQ